LSYDTALCEHVTALLNKTYGAYSEFAMPVFQNTGDCPMTEVDELKKNFRAIQEENYKLQAVITDVSTQKIK
jgi:polyhydroxyalkanoate synthesis regulator protein